MQRCWPPPPAGCPPAAAARQPPPTAARLRRRQPACPAPPAARCIDTYIEQRVKEAEGAEGAAPPDPRLLAIVERLFERCYADGQYEQAVGVALEARRLDQLERAIASSPGA